MSNVQTNIDQNSIVKSYQSVSTEGEITSNYNYCVGSPIQYRFNGQSGSFNREEYIVGDENAVLIKDRVQLGSTFTIIPIGFRFFEDELFLRKNDETKELKREEWVELFFINDKNYVSSILFSNTSCRELKSLNAKLYYAKISLTQVEISINPVEKKHIKGEYFVAKFKAKPADGKLVIEYKEFSQDYPIFQENTIQQSATLTLVSDHYPVQLFGLTYNSKTGLLLNENTV